jgi:hypothetical protein
MGKFSKIVAPVISQKTWLASAPKQRVLEKDKQKQISRYHEKQQSNYEEQREKEAREGIFRCKHTETIESRLDGQRSEPVSGHWYHNKDKGLLEMYNDIQQPPVQTKEVVFFQKRVK